METTYPQEYYQAVAEQFGGSLVPGSEILVENAYVAKLTVNEAVHYIACEYAGIS